MLLGIAASQPAFSLNPSKLFSQYLQSSWGIQNGLPQRSVMAVAQTADGLLWLATEEGLVRYNGKTFVTFDERNAPGLGDRFIRSLAAGPDGSLWIGTMSGLVYYKNGKFESLRTEPAARIDIYDLCVGLDGSVWFSSDQGLRQLRDGKLRTYTTKDGLPGNGINGLAKSPDGTLWIATTKGLASLKAGRFTTYPGWDGAPSTGLNAVATGRDGVVWIGTADGKIGRLANGRLTSWVDEKATRGSRIQCLREDRDGNLWIAYEKFGLARVRGQSVEVFTKANGLPSSNPDWIFEDQEKNLWVGWADAGLSMLRDAKFTMFGKAEGLSSDSISSVVQATDGSLWVGTDDAGVNRLESGNIRVYSTQNGLAGKTVLGMMQLSDGGIWAGSDSGRASRIENGHIDVFHLPGPLSPDLPAMAQDRSGGLWFGFDMPDGLARLRDGRFETVPLDGRGRIRGLAVAPDGALWIASYLYGLIELRNGVSRTYSLQNGLSSLFLTSVYVDRKGVVWAGTALGGLNRLQDGKITKYSVDQGLSDSTVGGIVEDDQGYLWLSGPRGIARVRLQELTDYAEGRIKAVHSQAFGYADGLRSVECNFKAQPAIWKTANGQLWFATTDGLAMIDPAHILINEAAPEVQIARISLDARDAPSMASGMVLGKGGGQVEIAFNAPTFVAPEAMHVHFRLVDVDRDWVDAGPRRSATYSNLAPGSYRFEVWAENNDGVRSTHPAAFEFRILPRYYQTYWFWGFCALCIGLMIWGIYISRVKYLVRRTQELETIVSQRTTELREALREAETARELLRDQAMRDSLTGFWNRRAIFEVLDGEIARCRKESKPVSILMADLDHFKNVNDTLGHLAGDTVLQAVSDCVRNGLRRHEAIGRYGGEEFLILLSGCPLDAAVRRAEAIRAAIETTPIQFGSESISVTCSFGVAECGSGCSVSDFIAEADAALYVAKNEGRNCVRPQRSRSLSPANAPAIPANDVSR